MSTAVPTRRRAGLTPPPTWIKPQLAKLVEKAPEGSDWLHEIKFDGYRMHARLDAGRVQILTGRANDWTEKYPAIAKSIARLLAQNAYLDGELCGVLPDGRTAFNLIQNATDRQFLDMRTRVTLWRPIAPIPRPARRCWRRRCFAPSPVGNSQPHSR
jgi:ATP-dependent DNA ligase